MISDTLYFLKISGDVRIGKHREFQQTIQFIINQLPKQCVSHNLAVDIHNTQLYHFFTVWQSDEALTAFRESNEFNLLKGAFQTLGVYGETLIGNSEDFQLFEVKHFERNGNG